MSVVFSATTWHLSNWAFGAGDIALLAGAGRQVITWMTTNSRDNGLLDFLGTTSSDLNLRRALVDPVALNKRWGKKLLLLQNGQQVQKSTEASTKGEIENVDRFTWIMTLVVVSLDVSVSDSTLQKIVIELCLSIFERPEDQTEYLQREIPEHIKGWRSNACARMMMLKARDEWRRLERMQQHLPGFIPDTESREIVRFFTWLLLGNDDTFTTSSSDVVSLAAVASEMGFDRLRTARDDQAFPEGYPCVIFSDSPVLSVKTETLDKRRYGMRVPLESPQESVTLWPGTPQEAQRRRLVFGLGSQAASDLKLVACSSPFGDRDLDPAIAVESTDPTLVDRIDDKIYRIAETCLLRTTYRAVCYLSELMDLWSISDPHERSALLSQIENMMGNRDTGYQYTRQHASEFQIFLLGYYYCALSSVIDDAQLEVKEGFGSWTWEDIQVFVRVTELVKSRVKRQDEKPGQKTQYWRYQVMKLVAFLYAGTTLDQLDDVKHGTAGVHGKISLVTPGLLGDVSSPGKISKFILLDVDATSIPSNGRGLIFPGKYDKPSMQRFIKPALDLEMPFSAMLEQDFTSHIEPAWDYDSATCLVTYRHHGRLVHKANPLEMEAAVLEWAVENSRPGSDEPWPDVTTSLKRLGDHHKEVLQDHGVHNMQLADCYDSTGAVVHFEGIPAISLFSTSTLGKAKSCILEMHAHLFVDRPLWSLKGYPWSEEFPGCIPVALERQAVLLLL
jgi:hypothetical protein